MQLMEGPSPSSTEGLGEGPSVLPLEARVPSKPSSPPLPPPLPCQEAFLPLGLSCSSGLTHPSWAWHTGAVGTGWAEVNWAVKQT